jgi:hypothetical protein
MELFIGSFVMFVLTALALGIQLVFRGRPMHLGCGGLPDEKGCKRKALCGGACRRKRQC